MTITLTIVIIPQTGTGFALRGIYTPNSFIITEIEKFVFIPTDPSGGVI